MQLGEGGTIEWMIALGIAWYLTERAVAILKGIHERRNSAADLYMDPKTGVRMSFPARNLQILHELVENECEQTELVRSNGDLLERIADTVDSRLLPAEEIDERLDTVVRKAVREEFEEMR